MGEINAIWGPPGAGKTTTLVDIFEKEIEETGKIFEDIAFSTYRKPLAREFQEKLKKRLNMGSLPDDVFIGTLHSLCLRLLKFEGYECGVAGPGDREEFCEEFNVEFSPDDSNGFSASTSRKKLGNLLFNLVSFCRTGFYDLSDYELGPIPFWKRGNIREGLVRSFHEEWEDYKSENGLIDYDDMLLEVYEQEYVPPVTVLLEDEFHDKTPVEYEIFKNWAAEIPKVYIAGDMLQAIYSFWNTDPEFFEEQYDNADSREVLPKSYRFGPDLWDYACRIVENVGLKTPDIETVPKDTEVDFLNMRGFRNTVDKVSDSSAFYLVRANYMMTPIVKTLRSKGIPFSVGHEKIGRVINVYNGVAKTREKLLSMGLRRASVSVELPSRGAEGLLKSYPERHFDGNKTEYYREAESKDRIEVAVNPSFRNVVSSNPFYSKFLLKSRPFGEDARKQAVLMWDRRGKKPVDLDKRHVVSTIHGSKGREADHVFLFDDITRSIAKDSDIENEARVFFVGTTRARKHLWIVHGPSKHYTYDLPEAEK
ncbi:hypothetical protein AKJ62_01305 [candidate division MSBL1 archaeon SCGC-AAA259D14]|uniref:UvrD-like helicase ATP-binding domain-containing protein n=1 Tax=candidate division MSBL1 archaeon SCGC-AAA259D14 TaxID=1698261 RepID=A0A133U7W2_9EURY|nr:hypothetical protein AKJ62_01305 [candidate division MSBL1 archaeon SCGC-AAA259D14]